MRTIIIGVGNPLLSDDSVGIGVVRKLSESIGHMSDVDCQELYTGGMKLMESMLGYDRAFLVDAMVTGHHLPGTVSCVEPARESITCHASSPHDTDMLTSLIMGKELGLSLPTEIMIWGIEAADVATFSEQLTPAVAAAVPVAVAEILRQLEQPSGARP